MFFYRTLFLNEIKIVSKTTERYNPIIEYMYQNSDVFSGNGIDILAKIYIRTITTKSDGFERLTNISYQNCNNLVRWV